MARVHLWERGPSVRISDTRNETHISKAYITAGPAAALMEGRSIMVRLETALCLTSADLC